MYNDFHHIIQRDNIDSVLIGAPDHWHAIAAVEATKHGKDVYCEKPEILMVREGQIMIETARRYGRVFSGGGMTDWDCHGFGGVLFACNLHHIDPVEIIPPDGKEPERLTYRKFVGHI